ncbi:MFS efflux pump atnC [Colletotrichum aenigma]|uniref:MFS efflux pump atnC n=1 Tax=Colletotrichum aenigma TaxID=1215731 RepID=UPI001872E97B|nr:MFS efflux pump atnC [Colletotrichum aenigma]KAF5525216.1 MFS efflux pump atnC [Colletotrichum aenigma]
MGCTGRKRKPEPSTESTAGHGDSIYWRPIVVVAMMLFIDGIGNCMSLAPQTRLFEEIVCRQYYKVGDNVPGSGPSEEMCKDPAVQDVVAELFGWQKFFDGIPGLILAMWFGVLADKQGRRRVFLLSVVGQVLGACWVLFICWLEWPLKLVWLSSCFLLIGGGSIATGAVAMMIITNASPKKYRSNVFFYAQAALIGAELIGPAIGSALMTYSLWHPLLLGLDKTAAPLSRPQLILQLANLLLSFRAFAQLVTFVAILPVLDLFISKKLGFSARVKDFLLSRLSIVFIMICFAVLVLAPSIPVVVVGLAFYTLGNGFSSFARSLLSSLVEKDMVGTLFTTLSMMDTLGSLLAGPIVARTFSWSMRLDGIWKGMPYVMSFAMCGLASLALSRAGHADLPEEYLESHDDEESRSLLGQDNSSQQSQT